MPVLQNSVHVVLRTSSVRCLIVDDSANFRDAASSMLERAGISVVGVACNSADALAQYRELRPDFTLVDVDLGAESGFDLAVQLHDADSPAPSVILISTHAEQDFADMIAASPALGFLPKFALSPAAIRQLLAHRV
jgi:DNA-binding NarL/FixJ family response regulator